MGKFPRRPWREAKLPSVTHCGCFLCSLFSGINVSEERKIGIWTIEPKKDRSPARGPTYIENIQVEKAWGCRVCRERSEDTRTSCKAQTYKKYLWERYIEIDLKKKNAIREFPVARTYEWPGYEYDMWYIVIRHRGVGCSCFSTIYSCILDPVAPGVIFLSPSFYPSLILSLRHSQLTIALFLTLTAFLSLYTTIESGPWARGISCTVNYYTYFPADTLER